MRPDLPSSRSRQDDDEDEDHSPRRRDRYDLRQDRFSRDEEHLRILSILYYVFGGLGVFSGLIPLVYVALGVVLLSVRPTGPAGSGPPPEIGWLMIGFGSGLSLVLLALAGCALFTGYNLSRKKRYLFCFVDACLSCIQMPLGTILGVFTIVVLARPEVKELFDNPSTETSNPEEQ